MNYKALKWIKKKHRVFRKYKNSSHPACRRVSKIVRREAKRAKYNFEKKLAENIKKDTVVGTLGATVVIRWGPLL